MATGSASGRSPLEVEVVIDDLAKGGAGVGRAVDGRVIFVDGALPGDRVRARIRRQKRRFILADLLEVLAPSPARITPPCELASRCGGCPWMGLRYAEQLAAKEGIVREALARLGGIQRDLTLPIVPSPRIEGYRGRARLHGRGGALGFHARRGDEIVDVPRCLVLDPRLQRILTALRQGGGERLPLASPLQLELAVEADGALSGALSGGAAADLPLPEQLGGAASHPGGPPPADEASSPSAPIRWERHPGPLQDPPALHLPFAQANPHVNALILARVIRFLAPAPGRSFLDIFCGSGNFAHPLAAAGAEVLGIEWRQDAVERAARLSPAPQRSRFIAGDAAQRLGEIPRSSSFDGAVLNPPRAGAREVLPALMALRPGRIAYVSCDPATLARDLATLSEGWEIREIQPYDMMPHTAHVEALALLEVRPLSG